MESSRIIIVSNRLPVKVEIKDDEWVYHSSEGGLATGLGSIYKEGNNKPDTCCKINFSHPRFFIHLEWISIE